MSKITLIQKNVPGGWQNVNLLEVSIINMGQSPMSSAYNQIKEGLPLIQGNNDIKNKKTVGNIWTTEITKTAEKGQLILTVRAPVGAVGIAHDKVCIGRGVCAIESKYKPFLWHFLNYFEPKWNTLEQGSTFTAVNSSDIKKIKLNLPPLLEQNRIVAVLETWDGAIEKLVKKIEIKKKIKKGLMQDLLTGKKRLSGFNDKWEELCLGNVGQVVTGNTPSKKALDYWGDTYLWATALDFNGVYIEDTEIKLTESGKSVSRVVPAGSILVTCIASIGKNAIARKSMSFNQQINAIIPNKKHNSEFIYYLIENSAHKLKEVAGGGALAMISKGVFEKIKLSFPGLEEQKAIAEILIIADKEITELECKLALVKEQKGFLLNNLITGAIRTPETM